jgi:hypothetical protein
LLMCRILKMWIGTGSRTDQRFGSLNGRRDGVRSPVPFVSGWQRQACHP